MSRLDYFIICICFVVSCFTFWTGNFWEMAHVEKPSIIFTSSQPAHDLTNQILLDPNTGKKLNLFLTRVLHNKITSLSVVGFTNLSRSTDLTFLFGITKETSFYENKGHLTLLYWFELPLFLLACVFWIKDWSFFSKKYLAIIVFLGLTLLGSVLVMPYFYLPKFFPFVVMLRIFIYFSLWKEFQKNYHF